MINTQKLVVSGNEREKIIIRTSIIGIITNLLLSGFKAMVGIFANSIAVILDAVNNLSDALSSTITIIATKLAGKRPDKNHPYGYGRIEYMSETIVASIVLYAGITALISSIEKIITPTKPNYSGISLIVIASSVVVKYFLGMYVIKKGKSVNSGSLVASGTDAISDVWLSASVLLSAIIYIISGISSEAFVGVVISLFIIKSGFEMIIESLNEILGRRISSELTSKIRQTAMKQPEVHGVYDIYLNNYGPDNYNGTLHIEVDDNLTAREIDNLSRKITEDVYQETGVILLTVGVYSVNLGNSKTMKMYTFVRRMVLSHDNVLQIHGFYVDEKAKTISFDIVIDFMLRDEHLLCQQIKQEIQNKYKGYDVIMKLDFDMSDAD